jgi:hypothetical protein
MYVKIKELIIKNDTVIENRNKPGTEGVSK